MDYKKLERATKSLLETYPHLLLAYEDNLREAVASQDLQLLLSNSIPNKIWANCIAMSLRHTAELAKSESLNNIAEQLWNPIVESLLTMLSKQVSVELTRPLPTKTAVRKPVTLTRSEAPQTTLGEQEVREQLMQKVDEVKFSSAFHKHIKCGTPSCKFCTDLYKQVHITRCVGHSPCHPSGYYPHVGKPLWNMLKTKHNKQTPCKLKNRPCKPDELPCLDNSPNDEQLRQENQDVQLSVEIDDQPDWLEQDADSRDSVRSEVYYPVVAKRPCTTHLH